MGKIKKNVIIVEKKRLVAECVAHLLRSVGYFKKIRIVGSIDHLLVAINGKSDWVVLLTANPLLPREREIRRIHMELPGVRVVLVDSEKGQGSELIVPVTKVCGYWTFGDSASDFLAGVCRIAAGECAISAEHQNLFDHCKGTLTLCKPSPKQGVRLLTRREKECFVNLIEHRDVSRCAEAMALQQKTIENYKYRIMKKLDTHTLADLVHFAYTHGLVE